MTIGDFTPEDLISVKLRLYVWRRSYNKLIAGQKWDNEEEILERLVTPEQVDCFQRSDMARNATTMFGVCQENNEPVTKLEFTNMRDYLMTSIALENAHRSGVAASATLSEYSRKKPDESGQNVIIRVKDHKTKIIYGPAVICLSKHKAQLLDIFVSCVRPQIKSDVDNIFTTWNGKPLMSGAVSRQINSIWVRSGVYSGTDGPKGNISTTVIRKSVTTLIHDNQRNDIEPVADLLSHSVTTAKKSYRYKDRERQAVVGATAIRKAVGSGERESKSVKWTKAQEGTVLQYFEKEIASCSITINEVREKLPMLAIDKTEKQTYDKIRSYFNHFPTEEDGPNEDVLPPIEEETAVQRVQRIVNDDSQLQALLRQQCPP